jgi:UPF0755 protein
MMSALKLARLIGIVILFLLVGGLYSIRPEVAFPHASHGITIIRVTKGEPLSAVADSLRSSDVVRFSLPAAIMLDLFGGRRNLEVGAYVIHPSATPLQVFWQMAHGDFGVTPLKVTIPEGATSYDIDKLLSGKFLDFDSEKFQLLAEEHEGYLFPDTYFFLPTATEDDVISMMTANFNASVATITPEITASGESLSDIVIVASLLEKEARTLESKRMIAGIIQNRLSAGMPLQIDAVFGYINGVNTFSPSLTDLATDSPYNTYKHKGLPPGPIANPGIESLEAAATPTKSNYLYYLTGTDGEMHYAKTFAEHVKNRQLYLN